MSNMLLQKIALSADWTNTPKINCHGDFTLENMIVSNEKLYLIDFPTYLIYNFIFAIEQVK